MKKLFFSLFCVAVGAGLWVVTARTARFSLKKWDAKFESVLRNSLHTLGVKDQDVVASVHQVSKDKNGQWITHDLTLKNIDEGKMKDLIDDFESTGAKVEKMFSNNKPELLVKRGNRIYQKIKFQ